MNNDKRILIVAGGTGGHIFPALAVANLCKQHGVDVQWLGSHVGLEKKIVSGKFPIHFIAAKRIRGKSIFTKLLSPLRIFIAIFQSWRIMRKIKPNVVLGMGGFVSGPGGIAAKLLGIPVVIHEQNSVAGYTNRILAKFAKQVLCGFPNAFPKQVNAQCVGNPVRAVITEIPEPKRRFTTRDKQILRLFIFGGSQGAHALNLLMMELINEFPQLEKLSIWHQTGPADFNQVQAAYDKQLPQAKVSAFIDDMVPAYSWADLILCRAGALTVAEIAAVGVGSILIPFPYAVDDHQFYNGKYLAEAHAAMVIRQKEMKVSRLQELLSQFLEDHQQLENMAVQARSLAKPDAAQMIMQACLNQI